MNYNNSSSKFRNIDNFFLFKIFYTSPSAKAKGLDLSCLPDWNIDRTFNTVFYFPQPLTNPTKARPVYQNPIYLAREYKAMIDSGKVINQAELARIKGISRARVT
jgi:hypothetical protein